MSYDIGLRTKNNQEIDFDWVENTNGGYPNVTANLANMFYALPCDQPESWNGKKAKDYIEPIKKSMAELLNNRKKYLQYESPNGWGTVDGAYRFLYWCLNTFKAFPEAYIEVSY